MTAHVTALTTAFMSALAGAAQVVERVRLRPLPESTSTAIVVRPTRVVVQETDMLGASVETLTAIQVECYARASGATAPDQALDPLLTEVQQRLLADPTLGGQIAWLSVAGAELEFDAELRDMACATVTFTARHRPVGYPL